MGVRREGTAAAVISQLFEIPDVADDPFGITAVFEKPFRAIPLVFSHEIEERGGRCRRIAGSPLYRLMVGFQEQGSEVRYNNVAGLLLLLDRPIDNRLPGP